MIGLTLVEAIKAVNYIRTQVKSGTTAIAIQSSSVFEDDCYLQPVLEDDALLYSLGDIIEENDSRGCRNKNGNVVYSTRDSKIAAVLITELRDELQRLQQEFVAYRSDVVRVLDSKWSENQTSLSTLEKDSPQNEPASIPSKDNDSHYFTSYSYNGQETHLIRNRN